MCHHMTREEFLCFVRLHLGKLSKRKIWSNLESFQTALRLPPLYFLRTTTSSDIPIWPHNFEGKNMSLFGEIVESFVSSIVYDVTYTYWQNQTKIQPLTTTFGIKSETSKYWPLSHPLKSWKLNLTVLNLELPIFQIPPPTPLWKSSRFVWVFLFEGFP